MRPEMVLGLLSSFQIYHQCMSNVFLSASPSSFGYSTKDLSVISASFPMGKLLGTLSVVYLSRRGFTNRNLLDHCAALLILGAVIMLVPFMFFLLLARFIVGLSVGIAFVSAFVALNGNAQDTDDTADRAHVFLGTAALFAVATFLINSLPYVRSFSHITVLFVFAVPALLSGLNYFWHRPDNDEESDISAADDGDIEPIKYDATVPNSHNRTSLHNNNDLEANLSSRILSILLMSINASIGVPLILAYCSVIYTHFGLSRQASLRLSSMYPLIQLGIILVFRHWCIRGVYFSSRAVLATGYAICLMATFFLLITVEAKTLDTQPQFKAAACAFWFTILAVTSGIPCNAGVALVGELFPDRRELVDGIAYSRAFFWIISTILSGTFLWIIENVSIFTAFAPPFIVSFAIYILLIMYLPTASNNLDSPTIVLTSSTNFY